MDISTRPHASPARRLPRRQRSQAENSRRPLPGRKLWRPSGRHRLGHTRTGFCGTAFRSHSGSPGWRHPGIAGVTPRRQACRHALGCSATAVACVRQRTESRCGPCHAAWCRPPGLAADCSPARL